MRSSKNMLFLFCFFCFCFYCSSSRADASLNLLYNPGFELQTLGYNLPDLWDENPSAKADAIVINRDSEQAHGGSIFISVRKSGKTNAAILGYGRLDLPNIRGRFMLERGHRYHLSVWARGRGTLNLLLYQYDSIPNYLKGKASSVKSVNKTWQRYDFILTPDSEAVCGLLAIHVNGNIDIDDASVIDLDGRRDDSRHYPVDPRLLPKTSDWFDLNLGVSTDVPAPWTPLSVVDDVVSCWSRQYKFTGSTPFPNAITTIGKSILSGSPALELVVNGKKDTWIKDQMNWVNKTGAVAQFSFRSHSLISGITLTANVDIEFDGMVKIDWTLSASEAKRIDSLKLSIPIKREHAKYFRGYMGEQNYDNNRWIAPSLVVGHSGQNSYSFKSKGFMYQVWLGDDSRGLAWITNSDQNWHFSGSAVEISNDGAYVLLKLNIIDHPFILTHPVSFMMILQATPVKPLPHGWEKWHLYSGGLTPLQAASYNASIFSQYTTGSELSTPETYPYPGDRSKIDRIIANRMQSHAAGLKYFLTTRTFCAGAETPAMRGFGTGWRIYPEKHFLDDSTIMQYVCVNASGWKDYYLYMARQIYRVIGNDGFYFDTSNAFLCANYSHGCGYLDDKKEWRPTLNILSLRDLYKRLYIMSLKEGKSPPMFHHHVAPLIPAIGFVDFTMDGEGWSDKPNYDDLFANDCMEFRLRFMEWQYGTVPLLYGVLGLAWRFSPQIAKATEEEILTLCLLHNMFPSHGVRVEKLGQIWKVYDSFDVGQSKWLPFWNNEGLIDTHSDQIKASIYKKESEMLIVIGNIGKKTYHGYMYLRESLLNHPSKKIVIINALTNKIVAKGQKQIEVDVQARGFLLLRTYFMSENASLTK